MDFKELIQSIANAPKVQLSSNVLIIVITIFVVPSLALSPYLLLAMFWALRDCLSNFLTNSHFYYFLLNFLIVTLVFTSGVLDEQGEEKEMSLQDESEHSDNDNDDKDKHKDKVNENSMKTMPKQGAWTRKRATTVAVVATRMSMWRQHQRNT